MNKKRIAIFLFTTLLFCANVFAQDEMICRITGEDCWKKSEFLKNIEDAKAKIRESQSSEIPDSDRILSNYFKLGVNYYYIGDYSNALSCFSKLEPDFSLPDTNVFRGLIYLDQGKNDEALKEFDIVINRKIDRPEAYFGRAEIFRQRRKYDDAIKNYDRALERSFRFSKAFFGRAIAYFKRGELARSDKNEDSAKADYKKGLQDLNSITEIDLDGKIREIYLYRAKIYEALGDDIKTEENFKKYKEITEN